MSIFNLFLIQGV